MDLLHRAFSETRFEIAGGLGSTSAECFILLGELQTCAASPVLEDSFAFRLRLSPPLLRPACPASVLQNWFNGWGTRMRSN